MAVAGPMNPISVPTELGAREVLDVGLPVLDLQKIDNPQSSLHQCSMRYGARVMRSIFDKLEQQDQTAGFEQLNLSDNNIGDEGAAWLMKGLTSTTSSGKPVGQNLKVLLMPRTRLGAKGVQSIGELIGASKTLENVVLSGNICDAEGMEGQFGKGLEQSTSLKSLCLAACRLGDKGAELLRGPLKAHPSLEHVSLQYNRFEVAAAKSLAAMLASNQALRFLDLSGNSLGPEGAKALVEGLKKNGGRLQRLSVAQNEITFDGAKAFCQLFVDPEGKNLEYLDLRHNAVPFKKVVELRKELGKPLESGDGWMMLFGERQLLLNR